MTAELGPPSQGVATAILHHDTFETVTYTRLDAGMSYTNTDTGGCEMLVIAGSVTESAEVLGKGAWLRLPAGIALDITAGSEGADVWIKTGHLIHAKPPSATA